METRKPAEISLSFNQRINQLLKMLEKRSTTTDDIANLDRLQQRVNMLRRTHASGGQFLMESAGPFLFKFKEEILERDEQFFLDMDVKTEIIKSGKKIEKGDEFMFSLIDNIKNMYRKAKQKERDDVYENVNGLLLDWFGYCMVTSKDPETPLK
jgi:hypothetical protein